MSFGSKTEERLERMISKQFEKQELELDKLVSERITGIFLWGVLFGIIIAWSHLISVIIGSLIGFCIAIKFKNKRIEIDPLIINRNLFIVLSSMIYKGLYSNIMNLVFNHNNNHNNNDNNSVIEEDLKQD